MADPTLTVGFIGLGNIGAPMASHLLDQPGGLVVCDVRPEATEPFAAKGAAVAASPAEVAAAGAAVISVMVLDDDQVRDVVASIRTAAAPGTVVAIHSTIAPSTAEELAGESGDVAILDAPVSGGFVGAHEGRLAVMVGGDRDAYEIAKPVFASWAELVMHMGPVGAGTRAKLARNVLTFAGYAVAAEAQRLAAASGIDLRKLGAVVRHSDAVTGGAGAIMVRDSTGPMTPGDPLWDAFHHARTLGEKDLALALALGKDVGVELPFAALALDVLAEGLGVA